MVNPCKSLVSAISDNLDAILNFLAEGRNYLLAQGGELLEALELRFGCVVMSWEHLVVWWWWWGINMGAVWWCHCCVMKRGFCWWCSFEAVLWCHAVLYCLCLLLWEEWWIGKAVFLGLFRDFHVYTGPLSSSHFSGTYSLKSVCWDLWVLHQLFLQCSEPLSSQYNFLKLGVLSASPVFWIQEPLIKSILFFESLFLPLHNKPSRLNLVIW